MRMFCERKSKTITVRCSRFRTGILAFDCPTRADSRPLFGPPLQESERKLQKDTKNVEKKHL